MSYKSDIFCRPSFLTQILHNLPPMFAVCALMLDRQMVVQNNFVANWQILQNACYATVYDQMVTNKCQ